MPNTLGKIETKTEQLERWMCFRGRFTTHEVIAFGLSIFSNGADRHKRKLCEKGAVIKLPKDLFQKEDTYQWVGFKHGKEE